MRVIDNLLQRMTICRLDHVVKLAEEIAPGKILSLVDPQTPLYIPGYSKTDRHVFLHFHDDISQLPGRQPPTEEAVGALLEVANAWDRQSQLLFHCHAGISRSPAAVLSFLCLLTTGQYIRECYMALLRARPVSQPNMLFLEIADTLLGLGGEMVAVVAETVYE